MSSVIEDYRSRMTGLSGSLVSVLGTHGDGHGDDGDTVFAMMMGMVMVLVAMAMMVMVVITVFGVTEECPDLKTQ